MGLKTEKVLSDHWKPAIYRPEWHICFLEPKDAHTRSKHSCPCKTLTHTVSSVRDDHFSCTSRWMATWVFALKTQAACLWRRVGLLGWFILLSCLNPPSVFLCHFVLVWFRSWGCSLLALPDRLPKLVTVQTQQECNGSGALNLD